ncbi:MAG: class II fructose-bisphosphate aldolase [Chloroflexota bacterium]|nr:class II fructose-bisphosphate aldolase [Chloroflexota bacterium]
MPLVNFREILQDATDDRYGVPCLLGGNLEMVVGQIRAAEACNSPLILAFNQAVTPDVPMSIGLPMIVNAAREAAVPVATILDHGMHLEPVVQAIHLGSSSVMYDGSGLPFEENVRQTAEIVRIAHSVGVGVEAELGGIGGSSLEVGAAGPEPSFTDPEMAAEFVERTGIDALAVSFGNAHGPYQADPELELDRVKRIRELVSIPLVMHGASGLVDSQYREIVESGISKINYYTAMARDAARDLRDLMLETEENGLIYHHIIKRSIDFYYQETERLLVVLGCAGRIAAGERFRTY